ncbi:MAG: hypothetical protein ACODAQ_10425 [Phycisphaeraceae bacterium]
MPRIELTDEQTAILADLLHNTISDLGMEIAATEQMDFRDQLKHRRDVLHQVLDRLPRPRSEAA